MAVLELSSIRKSWPSLELSVSLELAQGELLALAGPSGCGKSTILGIVAGLVRPDSGSVLIDGLDATHTESGKRGTGMVFQNQALFPHLDVAGNVGYALACRNIGKADRKATVQRLLAMVGLSGYEKRSVHNLSGGEAQRVALARTLAMNPRILLFDEPLSALDAQLKTRLRREIRDTQRALGVSSIYVTHDMEEAMAVADRLAVMEAGRILQIGPVRSLWSNPASAAVARFLACGPCMPIHSVQALDGGRLIARVDGGSVILPPGASVPDGSILFFPRSRVSLGQGRSGVADGGIVARCVSVEYLGDWAQCRMESGGTLLDLRFPAGLEPADGDVCTLVPDSSAVRVIPQRA